MTPAQNAARDRMDEIADLFRNYDYEYESAMEYAEKVEAILTRLLDAQAKEFEPLVKWAWATCQHKWGCMDSMMIGKCDCGAQEIFDLLEKLGRLKQP